VKGFADGQRVVVLVRPETIHVETDPSRHDGWNSIPGEVETITFHGAVTRLGVNLHGQRVAADITVAHTKPISLNQKIWLLFPPDACQVMAVDERS
jgi:ABC-type Fe3+/spermidine/putrescine transport system ATPase subunit